MAFAKTPLFGKTDEPGIRGYVYGMRLRGYSPGAQPDGVVTWDDEPDTWPLEKGKGYHSMIWYDRELTEKEMSDYDLDFLRTCLPSWWII